MKTYIFQDLLNESHKGRFVIEPNELTEIHVDYANMSIVVIRFRSKNHMLAPIKKESFSSLAGIFGTPTVEQKFNEIIKKNN